jgi:hypothetical protein
MFARLVRLFPPEFRDRFGDDMRELFRDQLRVAHDRAGARGIGRLWIRTLPSLVQAALLERRDTLHAMARRRDSITAETTFTSRRDSVLETLLGDLRFAGRMLRVHDVFVPGPGTTAVWQVNVPVAPQISGRNARAGDLAIRVLAPADAVLTAVDWRTFGSSEFLSGWKLEVRGSGNEFLVELGDERSLFSDGFE